MPTVCELRVAIKELDPSAKVYVGKNELIDMHRKLVYSKAKGEKKSAKITAKKVAKKVANKTVADYTRLNAVKKPAYNYAKRKAVRTALSQGMI